MLLALASSRECGFVCTGVLDLVSQQVTHLYCPREDPQSLSARDHHRLPAWGPNGGPYCFSSTSGVTLLDFGSGRASPCAVSGGQTSETHELCGAWYALLLSDLLPPTDRLHEWPSQIRLVPKAVIGNTCMIIAFAFLL